MIVRRLVALAVCVPALALGGCKEGDALPPQFEPTTATFLAEDSSDKIANYVTLEQASVDEGHIDLAVKVHDVSTEVSGLAMKLSYTNTFAVFQGCTDGDLLPPGTCYWAEPDSAGVVFIGRSVTGTGQAVEAKDSRTIVILEFLVFDQGADPLVVEGQNLGGGDATALLDANGDPIFVDWISGTLVGQ